MSTFKPDAGIPILTEIIEAPALAEIELAPAPAAPAPPAAMLDAERWQKLERELHDRVLQQVLMRIDFALEQRVRDSLADVLQTAVEGLSNEIRSGLQQTVKDVVTHAVIHEINSARSSEN